MLLAHRRWFGFMQLCLIVPIMCLPTIEQTNTQQSLYEENQQYFKRPELEDTIEEVQKILAQDPSLPRLTRGEIEELYEKVTREEYEKSIRAGDIGRADSMRALMLVLPYNTDNNTEENLQELYTRPPVTKVIDVYAQPHPIQFVTADPSATPSTETEPVEQLSATTYKPGNRHVTPVAISPTTYHPVNTFRHTTSGYGDAVKGFRPMTSSLPVYNYALNAAHVAQTVKPGQRFSSHYNAKNADFLKQTRPKVTTSTSTVKPMADILESYGIVGRTQYKPHADFVDDYFPAESAPHGVISTYVPQTVSQLQELHAQNLGPRNRPDAYSNFKPLNIGEELRIQPDVEGYLTRFGIVANRERKAKDDGEANVESELLAAKLGNYGGVKRARKGVDNKSNENLQLEKLLENLQELERLNVKPAMLKSTTTTTTTTTTSTTKMPTTTTRDLITNGAPMLIEAKKPVRRIDPNFDLNYGASSNRQTDVIPREDASQLEKLLENLQELQKLRINPENVLKANINKIVTTTTSKPVKTTAAIRAMTIINRFSDQEQFKQQQQKPADSQQLEEVLKQLQAAEQNRKTTTTTTTTTPLPPSSTTKRASKNKSPGLNDLSQLRRLLANDSELERLYNSARDRLQQPSATTTTTTSSTTSTAKPDMNDLGNLEELQKYLKLLERSTTTTSTTTTTTTRKPPTSTTTEKIIKNSLVKNEQILELINRVQELERANSKKPTQNPNLPFLGFTSRNVNSPKSVDNAFLRTSNDFAQLQQLYKRVQDADEAAASYGNVEISTPTTVVKSNRSKSQDFAQRIIDITNDTGSGSSLQQVDANEFVHLQKLLKKVQELERFKIGPDGIMHTMATSEPTNKMQRDITEKPNLSTVATEKVSVYALPAQSVDVRIDLPTSSPNLVKKRQPEPTSSEELRELVMKPITKPKHSAAEADFERYQEFFSQLEDNERNAYKNLQPPVIQKTLVKPPPKFVPTTKSPNDLKELQKLLHNAQELEKLGVTLPSSLSKKIETKLDESVDQGFKKIPSVTAGENLLKQNPDVERYLEKYGLVEANSDANSFNEITTNGNELKETKAETAVFSLTTMKPLLATTREIRTTTESAVQLPVFSATKIIEAAIKRAANKIGVSTEKSIGFRRRSDDDMMDMDTEDQDLMAEFSEINYQIATPDKPSSQVKNDNVELQRLIANLKELQTLNITTAADTLRIADAAYLESFKGQGNIDTDGVKNRRQSETTTTTTTTEVAPTTPTRIKLDLSLDDSDISSSTAATSSTTEEARNGSISDLEDSFGGPDPNADAPAPPKKKNGFYFLADWNSFLEVGDGDDQVVVRFSPKIGDPRLFIPVKIP